MIDVTCAIIRNDEGKILIVQRGEATDHPLKWEFPGGKLKEGETEEDCIVREISEELAMDIILVEKLPDVEHDYGFKKIRLIPFVCDTLDELPFLSEHAAYEWINPEQLENFDFSGADVSVARLYCDHFPSWEGEPRKKGSVNQGTVSGDTDFRDIIERLMNMKEAEWLAASAIDNPAIFQKLLEYTYSPEHKIAFRASWVLTKVGDLAPEIIYPHLNDIIGRLQDIDNESVLRCFLRVISLADPEQIGGKQHGILADICFTLLRSGFSAIAVKAYSMEILYKLAIIYPELRNELTETLNLIRAEGSAGIIARSRQILKKLN